MTKRFLPGALIVLLLAGARSGWAQTTPAADGDDNPTAYTALRTIGKVLGRDALDRVVEVSGRAGIPQPYVWKVVLKEGTGSREIDVAGGKIEAQRELTRPPASTAEVRLADLNLDSSGAFDATNAQAKRVKLPYNSLNYNLRVSPGTGKPVWNVDLFNKEGSELGNIRLAAHDGTLISTEGRLANNPPPAPAPTPAAPTTIAASTPRPTPAPRETPRPVRRPPGPRTTTTTVVTTTTNTRRPAATPPPPPVATTTVTAANPPEHIPVATLSDHADVADQDTQAPVIVEEGGLFTRTGRTLDKTSATVERGFRKAGASVQRFFTRRGDPDQQDQPGSGMPERD